VDKTVVTALLIVISMVMAVALFNAAYPAVVKGGEAITSMANRADERMNNQIAVIHMAGELDNHGQWQDANGNGQFDVFVWVKNIGAAQINAVERSDVFFGREGNFGRIPYQADADNSYPYWTWQIENSAEWTPTATVKITIHYAAPLSSGRYFARITLPSGISDDQFIGL
jgi:hypothetical protein